MPDATINHTPAGWPYLDEQNYIDVIDNYTLELANKLQNSDADVAAAINAAQRAETAAATAVAAAARLDSGWISVPLTAGVGTLVVTFKAGRFTGSPGLLYSFNTGANVAGSVIQTIAVSKTECTVKVTHGNTAYNGNVGISWLAVQL